MVWAGPAGDFREISGLIQQVRPRLNATAAERALQLIDCFATIGALTIAQDG